MDGRQAVVIIVLLASTPLAGCIGDDPQPIERNEAPTADTAVPTNASVDLVELTACSEQLGVFPFPAEIAQPMIPNRFEPVPMDPAGGTVTLVAISYGCQNAAGNGVAETWGFLQVSPPEGLAADEIEMYLVPLGGFSNSPSMLKAYEAWGIPQAHEGDVTVDLAAGTPVARAGVVHGTNGTLEVRIATTVEGPIDTQPPGAARVFGHADGEVTGAIDVTWTESQRIAQGEATFVENTLLPVTPESAGIGVHNWGEDYAIQMRPGNLTA